MTVPGGWLADDLAAALDNVPGCLERLHLAGILAQAARVRLDGAVTRAIAETVRAAAGSVERNLDRLSLLGTPALWIEYPHADRIAAFSGPAAPSQGGLAPRDVGCLLAIDPDQPAHVAVFVCWRLCDGTIRHSYAMLHWNSAAIFSAAGIHGDARTGGGGTGACGRLMALATASVPPGFAAEMEIWEDIPRSDADAFASALRRTERDALGEHLFLLASLLMLGSSAVQFAAVDREPGTGQAWEVGMAKAPARRGWPWARPAAGFSPRWSGPLAWTAPPTQPGVTEHGRSVPKR